MARLRPPKETAKPVPCFTSMELSKLRRACQGSSFEDRRDHRGVPGGRHPPGRADRDPLPPR
jgi:hypothetical protein